MTVLNPGLISLRSDKAVFDNNNTLVTPTLDLGVNLIQNQGGVILAETIGNAPRAILSVSDRVRGGTVTLNNAAIGHTFAMTQNAVLDGTKGIIDGSSLYFRSGTCHIANANLIFGAIGSVVSQSSTAFSTTLIIDPNAVLTGAAGLYTLGPDSKIINYGTIAAVPSDPNDVAVSLEAGVQGDFFTNHGVILTRDAMSLTFFGEVGPVTDGTIDNGVGSFLSLEGGATQTAGKTIVNGLMGISAGKVFDLQGGMLCGTGTIQGDVINNGGELCPGNSPGTLTILGNYTQNAGGSLLLELAGPDTFDFLSVSGAVTLGGTLRVSLLNGYRPSSSQMFAFLNAGGGIFGAFDSILSDTPGFSFGYSVNGNGATLTIGGTAAAPEPATLPLIAAPVFAALLIAFLFGRKCVSEAVQ